MNLADLNNYLRIFLENSEKYKNIDEIQEELLTSRADSSNNVFSMIDFCSNIIENYLHIIKKSQVDLSESTEYLNFLRLLFEQQNLCILHLPLKSLSDSLFEHFIIEKNPNRHELIQKMVKLLISYCVFVSKLEEILISIFSKLLHILEMGEFSNFILECLLIIFENHEKIFEISINKVFFPTIFEKSQGDIFILSRILCFYYKYSVINDFEPDFMLINKNLETVTLHLIVDLKQDQTKNITHILLSIFSLAYFTQDQSYPNQTEVKNAIFYEFLLNFYHQITCKELSDGLQLEILHIVFTSIISEKTKNNDSKLLLKILNTLVSSINFSAYSNTVFILRINYYISTVYFSNSFEENYLRLLEQLKNSDRDKNEVILKFFKDLLKFDSIFWANLYIQKEVIRKLIDFLQVLLSPENNLITIDSKNEQEEIIIINSSDTVSNDLIDLILDIMITSYQNRSISKMISLTISEISLLLDHLAFYPSILNFLSCYLDEEAKNVSIQSYLDFLMERMEEFSIRESPKQFFSVFHLIFKLVTTSQEKDIFREILFEKKNVVLNFFNYLGNDTKIEVIKEFFTILKGLLREGCFEKYIRRKNYYGFLMRKLKEKKKREWDLELFESVCMIAVDKMNEEIGHNIINKKQANQFFINVPEILLKYFIVMFEEIDGINKLFVLDRILFLMGSEQNRIIMEKKDIIKFIFNYFIYNTDEVSEKIREKLILISEKSEDKRFLEHEIQGNVILIFILKE